MSEHPTSALESSSLLPTLTRKANLLCPSMQKWAAHRRLLPTLTAQSYGTKRGGAAGRTGQIRLSLRTLAGGALNPTWCEWFMGFPENWTSLARESQLSETQLFRSAPQSSGTCCVS
jgi:hypothetical protein